MSNSANHSPVSASASAPAHRHHSKSEMLTTTEEIALLDRPATQIPPRSYAALHKSQRERDAANSKPLHNFPAYIGCLVFGYSALAIFAWVIACTLSYRAYGRESYGFWTYLDSYDNYSADVSNRHQFVVTERLIRAAKILQSIVSLLTFPIITLVCSAAAVTFIQQGGVRGSLTLRQTMVLADQGWTDPNIWRNQFIPRERKKYGSRFLGATMMIVFLGAIITPLQQIFLTTTTIKVPSETVQLLNQLDLLDHFSKDGYYPYDGSKLVALTRTTLATTNLLDYQDQLWHENSTDCSQSPGVLCNSLAPTLAILDILEHPFLSQFPSTFTSGTVRQVAPRINSSVTVTKINSSDFPIDCRNKPGSFYAQYSSRPNISTTGPDVHPTYILEACMPQNLSQSPWKATHSRQDFAEELYLNITLWSEIYKVDPAEGVFYQKITLNTTAGYFELPNYMNQGQPGPLIEANPFSQCGHDCIEQNFHQSFPTTGYPSFIRGPLHTLALALFGNFSFIEQRSSNPSYFLNDNSALSPNSTSGPSLSGIPKQCVELAPMQFLAGSGYDRAGGDRYSLIQPCVTNNLQLIRDVEQQVFDYLVSFVWNSGDDFDNGRIANAWNAAAFLANAVWFNNPSPDVTGTLTVSYNLGVDLVKPVISLAGIIVVSSLEGLLLLSLVGMTIYSLRGHRWANYLDSFAMMRIGASHASDLPMNPGVNVEEMEVLDQKPGWLGDTTGGEGGSGIIGLGARHPILKGRKYR